MTALVYTYSDRGENRSKSVYLYIQQRNSNLIKLPISVGLYNDDCYLLSNDIMMYIITSILS